MKKGNLDKCCKCGKDLTDKEKKLVAIYAHNMCRGCHKKYIQEREGKYVDMPWYNDWIYEEPKPIQIKKKLEGED